MSTGVAIGCGLLIGLLISISVLVLAPHASDYGDAPYRSQWLTRTLVGMAIALSATTVLALIVLPGPVWILTAIGAFETWAGAALLRRRRAGTAEVEKPLMADDRSEVMTLDDVAELLDSPRSAVAALVARDAIPYERPSSGIRRFRADELHFQRDEIQAWLERESQNGS